MYEGILGMYGMYNMHGIYGMHGILHISIETILATLSQKYVLTSI